MVYKSTMRRLFEQYNTYTRRPTARDEKARAMMFTAFNRTLGGWLPSDKSVAILDVGCGEGSLLLFLRRLGYRRLMGFDVSPENVRLCHELGLGFVEQRDALRLGELQRDVAFGLILMMDILEHIPKRDVAGLLEQARERLQPGGSLIIQTPNMGSLAGTFYRYIDLSHEFGLTERSARDLLNVSGFRNKDVEIRPAWNATTVRGRLREWYLRALHQVVFLADGSSRPRIPTKNLLIRARVAGPRILARERPTRS